MAALEARRPVGVDDDLLVLHFVEMKTGESREQEQEPDGVQTIGGGLVWWRNEGESYADFIERMRREIPPCDSGQRVVIGVQRGDIGGDSA